MTAKRTPLYEVHRALGARMIAFGGWQMPVQYTGILAEHRAVRTQGGLFDLSHMGEVEIAGPRAYAVCQELFVTDIARIQVMQAQYSVMCFADGGIVDDVIIYRLAEERYLVCVNAANRTTDYEWMVEHNRGRAEVTDRSDEYALIALQGPQAPDGSVPVDTARSFGHSPLLGGPGGGGRSTDPAGAHRLYRRRWFRAVCPG